ncbi:MAG: helix-turn-helix transcriptional regulator [Candidatus Bathyarchaeota archaeon]
MPSRKQPNELSVFRGRKSSLNLAIFEVLKQESPLIIYDITKRIQNKKGFGNISCANVGRRLRALEEQGFVEKVGSRETQPGSRGKLYRLTVRAKVALLYNMVSRDKFIKEADKETLAVELATLQLFIKKMQEKPVKHSIKKNEG